MLEKLHTFDGKRPRKRLQNCCLRLVTKALKPSTIGRCPFGLAVVTFRWNTSSELSGHAPSHEYQESRSWRRGHMLPRCPKLIRPADLSCYLRCRVTPSGFNFMANHRKPCSYSKKKLFAAGSLEVERHDQECPIFLFFYRFERVDTTPATVRAVG